MHKVVDGPIGDEILKEFEPHGLVALAFYDSGARSFYTTKKQIKSLEDVKGLKIRVQQSDLWVSLMQAMGANATPMPFGELYSALQTGVIDGAENNWPSYESSGHFEVSKFYTITEHSLTPEVLVRPRRVRQAEPEDQKTTAPPQGESVVEMPALGRRRKGPRPRWARPARPSPRRQGAVHRRDEAGLRQVRHRCEDEGPGRPHPGHPVRPSRGRSPGPRATPVPSCPSRTAGPPPAVLCHAASVHLPRGPSMPALIRSLGRLNGLLAALCLALSPSA
jgi:hypothetical protein